MGDTAKELPKTDKGLAVYLRNLAAPPERTWIALGDGLTICLEPSGMKTFQARLRRQGDKAPRRIRIGSFPAVSLVEARAKLAEMKSVVREGRDPALEQRRARGGIETPRTLEALVAEYLNRRSGQIASKTYRLEKDLLEGVLSRALGSRLVADLAPVDIGRAVSDYAARLRREGRSHGTNANKLLATTRRLFKLARGWGIFAGADPTAGLVKPAKEAPRDQILHDGAILVGPDTRLNEIGRLVCALQADDADPESASTRAALLLTLRLGLRAAEVCALEWRAIDLGETPSLAVTQSKTKAGLRTLPLPKAAAAALKARRPSVEGPWVFPARSDAKRAAHLHPESLSRAFARLCDRLRLDEKGKVIEGVGLDDVTTHDLRRTAISGLEELGHGSVVKRIAGHEARDVTGRHYDRSRRIDAMRAALEAWSIAIDGAAERHREPQTAEAAA